MAKGIDGFRGILPMPEYRAVSNEVRNCVREQLERLPEVPRMVALLWWFEGCRAEEIADILECSKQTVYNHLGRAKSIFWENESMVELFNQSVYNRNVLTRYEANQKSQI